MHRHCLESTIQIITPTPVGFALFEENVQALYAHTGIKATAMDTAAQNAFDILTDPICSSLSFFHFYNKLYALFRCKHPKIVIIFRSSVFTCPLRRESPTTYQILLLSRQNWTWILSFVNIPYSQRCCTDVHTNMNSMLNLKVILGNIVAYAY